jgi:uncharacterized protein involved in exopolysaccharide biosynthesis
MTYLSSVGPRLQLRFIFAGLLSIGLAGFFAVAQSWREGFVVSADVAFILLSGAAQG